MLLSRKVRRYFSQDREIAILLGELRALPGQLRALTSRQIPIRWGVAHLVGNTIAHRFSENPFAQEILMHVAVNSRATSETGRPPSITLRVELRRKRPTRPGHVDILPAGLSVPTVSGSTQTWGGSDQPRCTQEVVRRMLDHDSPPMIAHYAPAQHYDQTAAGDARKVDVHGHPVAVETSGSLAETSWAKQQLGRAAVALANCYCGLSRPGSATERHSRSRRRESVRDRASSPVIVRTHTDAPADTVTRWTGLANLGSHLLSAIVFLVLHLGDRAIPPALRAAVTVATRRVVSGHATYPFGRRRRWSAPGQEIDSILGGPSIHRRS